MLIRICLILAVVAAIAVGVVNFVVVKDKIGTLVADRNTNRDNWHSTQAQLAQTNAVLVKTQGTLKQTQQDLADTPRATRPLHRRRPNQACRWIGPTSSPRPRRNATTRRMNWLPTRPRA